MSDEQKRRTGQAQEKEEGGPVSFTNTAAFPPPELNFMSSKTKWQCLLCNEPGRRYEAGLA